MSDEKKVHEPMVLKMEKICKGYIDQLENGGKEFNFQNFMMMYIFGACMNTEYRTKLFDHWPTVIIIYYVPINCIIKILKIQIHSTFLSKQISVFPY